MRRRQTDEDRSRKGIVMGNRSQRRVTHPKNGHGQTRAHRRVRSQEGSHLSIRNRVSEVPAKGDGERNAFGVLR